jgi:hypothetical protein
MASIKLFFRLSCFGLALLVQIGSASSIPEDINIREGYFLNDDPNLQDDWSTNNDIDVDESYTLRNRRQVALPTERDRRYGVVDKVEHGKVYSIQNMRDSMVRTISECTIKLRLIRFSLLNQTHPKYFVSSTYQPKQGLATHPQ